ncbi:MAG: hypothetical protein GY757_31910 [bacterium]|nr:hypothetical protein [bacterium]
MVYTDTPTEMDVQYGSALTAGVKSFTVKVSEEDQVLENALVALYMNGVLYGSAYTGVSGYAAVQINATLPDSGSMEVNVTASNKIPYSGTVEIVATEEQSLLNPKKIYIIK